MITQEYKELLLQDLCSRLPYGVKVSTTNPAVKIGVISGISIENKISVGTKYADIVFDCIDVKPYLRPMSSMTEEEGKELQKITNNNFYVSSNYISNSNTPIDGEWHTSYNNFVTNAVCNKLISWLDKKHFDHRTDEEGKTLIEKGLAIAVTKENNPYK